MARFWLSNTHVEGQCEEMGQLVGRAPADLQGLEVWCTCPSGEHAAFAIVEGTDAQSVLERLPAELLIGSTRVLEMESATL